MGTVLATGVAALHPGHGPPGVGALRRGDGRPGRQHCALRAAARRQGRGPAARSGSVERRRLVDRLLANSRTRLTVVIAPAGWGKTTLLAQWAHDPAEARPIAWVSLDESDDEPVRFWTYVLTALASTGLGSGPLASLAAPGVEPVDAVVPMLLNKLASSPQQRVLVLDDYHLLDSPRIHESVEFLLAYLPGSLRVVLAGRSDPPLPLARLRARADLTELRADDLRFTPSEAADLVRSVGGLDVDAAAEEALWERTEGWAAGLQLAALVVGGSARPADGVAALREDDRHLVDYFDAEVLERLPAEHRDLLVRTSVLERLCGPLCDAVLERTGSAAVLDRLDRAHVFVVPLDRGREWYRTHRLFRAALRRRLDSLDPDAAPRLLRRSAAWFERAGHVDEAVRQLVSAGDDGAALELLRSSGLWFIDRGAAATQLQLGARLVAASPDPHDHLTMAFAAAAAGQFERIGGWLASAEPLIDDASPPLAGWSSLRAGLLATRAGYDRDVAAALTAAEEAVRLESAPGTQGYVVARVVLGAVLNAAGRSADAAEVLSVAWRDAPRSDIPVLVLFQGAGQYASSLLATGRLADLDRLLAEVSPAAARAEREWADGAAAAVSLLRIVEGRAALVAADLARAREVLRHAARLSAVWGEGLVLVLAHTALAEVELALGDRTAARAAVDTAREVADTEQVRGAALHELEAVEARLGRGSVRAARRAGLLVEELTDRELSILRMLPGTASQREIGAALFLSVNTVKGYTKSLYHKLDVASRADAVARGRALGLL